MTAILLYTGAAVIFLWGAGHLYATRDVVRGFGPLSGDNRRIITMEWIAEGMILCFIGVQVFTVLTMAGPNSWAAVLVGRTCAGLLIALAVLSAFTGARTSILPMRICPVVKTVVAVLFLAAAV